MSRSVETSGDIEIFCTPEGIGARGSVPFFDKFTPGDRISMVFTPNDGSSPPYKLKVFSPSGANIMDAIVRDLPTGLPQSPPPMEFVVSARGVYRIEIQEMRGRQRGEAKLRVD